MNDRDFRLIASFGLIANSALYLSAVIACGLIVHNPWAWRLGVAAVGVTYLSYTAHLIAARFAFSLVILSIALGALAGLSLLVV